MNSELRTARWINRRKQHLNISRTQFHRRPTSKYDFRRGPESDRSEEPKFSGSGRLQINDDFLLRDDHFGALLAAGKPGPI